jgi:hypothetical protein
MIIHAIRIVFPTRRKGYIMSILVGFFLTSILSGQRVKEDTPPLKERLFYGGSFSLQLGTITNIEVSPVIGLWVLPRLAVAAGPNYRFYKDWIGRTNIYGGRSYVQFVIFRDLDKFIPLGIHTSIFLHCEDEMLSLESEYWKNITYDPKRFLINTVLGGAGISQQVGKRSSFNIMVLWALNDPGYDIYGNPEIRVGFVF